MTGVLKERDLGASRKKNQRQETGRVLGLRLGWVCWSLACTTPCAELGKLDFLFPKKSSYIRLCGQRERKKEKRPKPPAAAAFLPRPTWLPQSASCGFPAWLPPHLLDRACASTCPTAECPEAAKRKGLSLPARDPPAGGNVPAGRGGCVLLYFEQRARCSAVWFFFW